MYDVVIIGAGPGGLAAAIYAQRAELSAVVLERAPVTGGQIINTYEVDNYPGIPGVSKNTKLFNEKYISIEGIDYPNFSDQHWKEML